MKERLIEVQGAKAGEFGQQRPRISANLPAFSASWGFSKNFGFSASYLAENRARSERLKRLPR
jgi:hypothetical protein